MNPTLVLREIRRTLDNAPNTAALRRVREALDEPTLFWELDRYLGGVNDPDIKATILSDIIAISRQCGDRTAERKNDLTMWRELQSYVWDGTVAGTVALVLSVLSVLAAVYANVVLNRMTRRTQFADKQFGAEIDPWMAEARRRYVKEKLAAGRAE